MKHTTLTALPLKPETREYLLENKTDIDGALVYFKDSADHDASVAVYGEGCSSRTFTELLSRYPQAVFWWSREEDEAPTNNVEKAIALVDHEKLTPYAAAKKIGINVSAVYRAIKLRKGRGVCLHCGQLLPKEQS